MYQHQTLKTSGIGAPQKSLAGYRTWCNRPSTLVSCKGLVNKNNNNINIALAALKPYRRQPRLSQYSQLQWLQLEPVGHRSQVNQHING